jgi:hypothetical protein
VVTRKTITAHSYASDHHCNIKSCADDHANLPRIDIQNPEQSGPAMWPLAYKPVAMKSENASTRPLTANDERLSCGFFIARNLTPS